MRGIEEKGRTLITPFKNLLKLRSGLDAPSPIVCVGGEGRGGGGKERSLDWNSQPGF